MKDGSHNHVALAEKFNADEARVNWHDETLWWVRQKRDKQAWQLPEWEQLRDKASEIKLHTLSNLHDYLLQFEQNAQRHGITVHWAADAQEHNTIVHSILQKHGAFGTGSLRILVVTNGCTSVGGQPSGLSVGGEGCTQGQR